MLAPGRRRVVGRRSEIPLLSGRSCVIREDEGVIPRAGDARPPGLGYGPLVDRRRPLLTRVRSADTDRVLALCGVLVTLGALAGLFMGAEPVAAPVSSVLTAIAGGLAVAFARRRPTAAILGFSLTLVAAVACGSELDQQTDVLTLPFFLLPVFWAANTDQRTFLRTLPLVVVLFPLGFVLDDPSGAAPSLVFILLVPLGLGAAGGRLLHWHTEAARRLERQAQELAANRDARAAAAVTAERTRIARDLHDLIAHDVSVMVVQAQAAERLTLTGRDGAGAAIAQIEQTGREALSEMRRLLGVLRTGEDDDLALRPQPSLRRIVALMDRVRAEGVEAELEVEGPAVALPPGIDMAAYRILSEGLRSVTEFGGARHAAAVVRRSPATVELQLEADGPMSPAALAGVRERTLLFGGSMDVAADPEGRGGTLRIRLPLGDGSGVR